MNVFINDKEQNLPDGSTVQELAASLGLPEKGTALAVNNRLIPRTEWMQTRLRENDRLVIIKAACGG